MDEVGVAFPEDETTAQVIASRLRSAGIAARVDRGLFGTGQVPQRGQMTVFVDKRHARRAHKLLGTTPHRAGPSEPALRFGIVFVVIALAIGLAMIVVILTQR